MSLLFADATITVPAADRTGCTGVFCAEFSINNIVRRIMSTEKTNRMSDMLAQNEDVTKLTGVNWHEN